MVSSISSSFAQVFDDEYFSASVLSALSRKALVVCCISTRAFVSSQHRNEHHRTNPKAPLRCPPMQECVASGPRSDPAASGLDSIRHPAQSGNRAVA